jgi:hypothetical protein
MGAEGRRPSDGNGGAKVKAVHESSNPFPVDLESGSRIQVRMADAGSSVALREKGSAVECLI